MPRKLLSGIDDKLEELNPDDHQKAVFVLHDLLNLEVWPEWIREEKPLLIFIENREMGNELPHHKMKAVFMLNSMGSPCSIDLSKIGLMNSVSSKMP